MTQRQYVVGSFYAFRFACTVGIGATDAGGAGGPKDILKGSTGSSALRLDIQVIALAPIRVPAKPTDCSHSVCQYLCFSERERARGGGEREREKERNGHTQRARTYALCTRKPALYHSNVGKGARADRNAAPHVWHSV